MFIFRYQGPDEISHNKRIEKRRRPQITNKDIENSGLKYDRRKKFNKKFDKKKKQVEKNGSHENNNKIEKNEKIESPDVK